MDIVLDSNIYRSDLMLKSKDFDIMLDYIYKTNSSIILPQIILDEVTSLYKRTLTDKLNTFKSSLVNLKNIINDKDSLKDEIIIDPEKETEDYIKFLKKRLNISDKNILPYNNDFLPTIATRAINRQKPSGENGQGFRDTLIWLTIQDYCKNQTDKQIIFISLNTDDFAHTDKITLHESLIDECTLNGIELHYYKNLKEFVENHSTKIKFITNEWINESVSDNLAEDLLLEELQKTRYNIPRILNKKTEMACTEYYSIASVTPRISNQYFVYEMADNTIVVNLLASFEVEVEYEYEIEHWERHQNDLIGMGHLNHYSTNYAYAMLNIDGYISLTVKEKKIIDTILEDCDIY